METQDFYWEIRDIGTNKELLSFIKKNKDQLSKYDWLQITKSPYFSLNMVPNHIEDIDWQYLCTFYQLPVNFLDKYAFYLDWFSVSSLQNLSLDFIKKYEDKLSFDKLITNDHIRVSKILTEVNNMYEKRKKKTEYLDIWDNNRKHSIFTHKAPVIERKETEDKKPKIKKYDMKELHAMKKDQLKLILAEKKIRVYYHDTLDELKEKILKSQED